MQLDQKTDYIDARALFHFYGMFELSPPAMAIVCKFIEEVSLLRNKAVKHNAAPYEYGTVIYCRNIGS